MDDFKVIRERHDGTDRTHRSVQAAEPRDEQKGDASMDGGTVTRDPLALPATLMTEERAYMARWLALEVLRLLVRQRMA
jgi:hypothetical protein